MNEVFLMPHEVIESEKFKKLRLSSKYLYCYLAKLKNQYQDRRGLFWHKMIQITVETGMNLKTVKRAKKELLENGFIEVKRSRYCEKYKTLVDFYRVLEFPYDIREELDILNRIKDRKRWY